MAAANQNPLSRIFFLVLGLLCLIAAGLGIALPGLPTTPFLLLAAACFTRSSPRLHAWLLNNRFFGPLITNWEESRSIPRRAKLIAITMVVVVAAISLFNLDSLAFRLALLAALTIPLAILIRLKETESVVAVKKDEEQL